MPGSTRGVTDSAMSGPGFLVRLGSRILRGLERKKARGSAAFGICVGDASRAAGLRCHGERLDVPELGQKGVLVVVATAGYDPSLPVKVADFTERE
jgi:hypothetical protein